MKPTLVLAGIPRYSMRHRDRKFATWFEAKTTSWNPKFVWSETKDVDLGSCWPTVQEIINSVENDANSTGLHLLLFHKSLDTRHIYESGVFEHHRMRFLPTATLTLFGGQEFYDFLDESIHMEEEWRARIRPDDLKHPLILPEAYFSTTPFFSDAWKRARATQSSPDICEIADLLSQFQEKHLNKGDYASLLAAYVDKRDAYFKFPKTADYHGIAESPSGNWKFAFRIEDGFHYDVGPESGKGRFELHGPSGIEEFQDNVNIYPHGACRP